MRCHMMSSLKALVLNILARESTIASTQASHMFRSGGDSGPASRGLRRWQGVAQAPGISAQRSDPRFGLSIGSESGRKYRLLDRDDQIFAQTIGSGIDAAENRGNIKDFGVRAT